MGYLLLLGAGTLSGLGFHKGAVLKPVNGCCIGGRAEAEYCEMLSAGMKGMETFSISTSLQIPKTDVRLRTGQYLVAPT